MGNIPCAADSIRSARPVLVSRFTTSEVARKASPLERRPWLGGYVRKEVDNALTFRKYADDAYDHG